jgi:hypothetical protein
MSKKFNHVSRSMVAAIQSHFQKSGVVANMMFMETLYKIIDDHIAVDRDDQAAEQVKKPKLECGTACRHTDICTRLGQCSKPKTTISEPNGKIYPEGEAANMAPTQEEIKEAQEFHHDPIAFFEPYDIALLTQSVTNCLAWLAATGYIQLHNSLEDNLRHVTEDAGTFNQMLNEEGTSAEALKASQKVINGQLDRIVSLLSECQAVYEKEKISRLEAIEKLFDEYCIQSNELQEFQSLKLMNSSVIKKAYAMLKTDYTENVNRLNNAVLFFADTFGSDPVLEWKNEWAKRVGSHENAVSFPEGHKITFKREATVANTTPEELLVLSKNLGVDISSLPIESVSSIAGALRKFFTDNKGNVSFEKKDFSHKEDTDSYRVDPNDSRYTLDESKIGTPYKDGRPKVYMVSPEMAARLFKPGTIIFE